MRRFVLLRFDDICPTMNWELWERAMSLLEKSGSPKVLLGVIPDCKDPDLMIDEPREDFWEYIRGLQQKGHTIAMHGFNHVFDSNTKGLLNNSSKSEFAGHPYDIQYEKIRKGKEMLASHGIETDVFFAPAHSYDRNTLKALAANGFKYISDGKSRKPYIQDGIICIPARSGGIPKYTIFETYVTAIVHVHEWVRDDKKNNWDRLVDLCYKNNKTIMIVPFDSFKEREQGLYCIQKADEKIYMFLYRYIVPLMAYVKNKL